MRWTQTFEERFWSKVDKSGDCWVWTANSLKSGYGLFRAKRNGRWANEPAHRVSFSLAHGDIPAGLEIDHVCRTRSCVRPDHLRAVTHKQNLENADPKGNANSTSGVRGVSWSKSKQRWIARLQHNGRAIHVGTFTNPDSAKEAVVEARKRLFTHNELDRSAA
jgi:hypothetical protein